MPAHYGHRPELPDAEGQRLVRAARDGDRAARARLFDLYADALHGWIETRLGKRLGRAVSLSDLAQESFLRTIEALRLLPDDAGLAGFEGLLFRNARWYLLKQARSHRDFEGESAAGIPPERAPLSDPTHGLVTCRDEVEHLVELIRRLPGEQAAVLRRRLTGKTFAAIARELEITEETARKRHLRGTMALRALARDDPQG